MDNSASRVIDHEGQWKCAGEGVLVGGGIQGHRNANEHETVVYEFGIQGISELGDSVVSWCNGVHFLRTAVLRERENIVTGVDV